MATLMVVRPVTQPAPAMKVAGAAAVSEWALASTSCATTKASVEMVITDSVLSHRRAQPITSAAAMEPMPNRPSNRP